MLSLLSYYFYKNKTQQYTNYILPTYTYSLATIVNLILYLYKSYLGFKQFSILLFSIMKSSLDFLGSLLRASETLRFWFYAFCRCQMWPTVYILCIFLKICLFFVNLIRDPCATGRPFPFKNKVSQQFLNEFTINPNWDYMTRLAFIWESCDPALGWMTNSLLVWAVSYCCCVGPKPVHVSQETSNWI